MVLEEGAGTTMRPELTDAGNADIRRRLRAELLQTGLYDREVEAMLETWKDDWFEKGLRVFYLLTEEQTELEFWFVHNSELP